MTASRLPAERKSFTSPVIDYEPAPVTGPSAYCPAPTPSALHRHTPRPLRSAGRARPPEPPAPPAAAVFAEAALRRVLEVIDRRRPLNQLQPLLDPALFDSITALTRSRHAATATLRRVRLRASADGSSAAEVFATYSRGDRLRAIAGRVERSAESGRWRLVALQIG